MYQEIEIGFEGSNGNLVAFIYHLCDTNKDMLKKLRQRGDTPHDPRHYTTYGTCLHPHAYCDYEHNTVNLVVDIFLDREHYNRRVLYHETYHALKMVNHVFDKLGSRDEEDRYNNEEVVADLMGELIPEVTKKVLPKYKEAHNGRTQRKDS